MLKLIYIAGKFSGPTRADVENNIMAAVRVGIEVARAGGMPVIPHANTAHPEFETVQPYEFWIEGATALLRKCDAVMLVSGWTESSGARSEEQEAKRLGLPVFLPGEIGYLRQWIVMREQASDGARERHRAAEEHDRLRPSTPESFGGSDYE